MSLYDKDWYPSSADVDCSADTSRLADEATAHVVNPEYLIYCIEGSRIVIALREGARKPGMIEFGGEVEDIYEADVQPGQYVTCNKRGLFRLGASPVAEITAILGDIAR